MVELKYAFKNIIKMVKMKPIFFVLIELYICLCAFSLFFCCGIIGNYNELLEQSEATYDEKYVAFQFSNSDNAVTADNVKMYISTLDSFALNEIDSIASYVAIDEYVLDVTYKVDTEGFKYNSNHADNYSKNKWILRGRYFTEEEFNNGDKVILIPDIEIHGDIYGYNESTNTITLGGENYYVIGWLDNMWTAIPITALPEDTEFFDMLIGTEHKVNKALYDELINKAILCFGDTIYVEEKVFDDAENQRFYRKMIVQESLVILIIVINMLVLLIYLFSAQENKMRVYLICGYRNIKNYLTIMLQWLIMIIPMYFFAFFVFDDILKPKLASYYPYISLCMDEDIYLIISLIFYGLLCLFGTTISLRRVAKPSNERRRGL